MLFEICSTVDKYHKYPNVVQYEFYNNKHTFIYLVDKLTSRHTTNNAQPNPKFQELIEKGAKTFFVRTKILSKNQMDKVIAFSDGIYYLKITGESFQEVYKGLSNKQKKDTLRIVLSTEDEKKITNNVSFITKTKLDAPEKQVGKRLTAFTEFTTDYGVIYSYGFKVDDITTVLKKIKKIDVLYVTKELTNSIYSSPKAKVVWAEEFWNGLC